MINKAPLTDKTSPTAAREMSIYDELLLEAVKKHGGFYNAHAHLDRTNTLPPVYLQHINLTPMEASSYPLSVKQNLTGDLHKGLAYTAEDLRTRMSDVLLRLADYGTTGVATCIDVAEDISEKGLLAMDIALELKEEFDGVLDLRIAPNPIFGFKEGTKRWEIYKKAAKMADFLTTLPEKDSYLDPRDRDGRIGFRQNIRKVIELGCELGKEVHLHLDQANDPREVGTISLIEGLRWMDKPPGVWAIHSISPSAYDETDFRYVVDGLLEHGVGVIVCPTAALSMRQLRPIQAPMHNSIARVLELIVNKVPVRIGTDNICDVFVPQSSGDMLTEMLVLGHAVRFANPDVLGKLAAGVELTDVDREIVQRTLNEDHAAYRKVDREWRS
jgi:cytosine/adenosine deaminase-related metal-dependent hydrolase